MALPSYPLINGKRYDYSSIAVVPSIVPKQFLGVQSIDYTTALKPGSVYGTSARKQGRTRGKHEPSGSMTVYREEFGELIKGLIPPGIIIGFMEVEFQIVVKYQEDLTIQHDELLGCRISNASNSHSAGNGDSLMVKLDLDVMDIIYNSIPAVSVLKR